MGALNAVVLMATLLGNPASPESPEELLAVARAQYERTDYAGALQTLSRAGTATARAHELLGKIHYAAEDYERAVSNLEKAVEMEPGNAEYRMWLGRAWGRRAETSWFLLSPTYAVRARESFEKAVELDPRNTEALTDLFEYYLTAPAFLGGGVDKADAIHRRIAVLDSVKGHWIRAALAEARREYSTAEAEYRRAVEAAQGEVSRLLDLAKFLARRGRLAESDGIFQTADTLSPNNPEVYFERAAVLIDGGRDREFARTLLAEYLRMPLTPDLPSRREAERLLKRAGG
jgi:Flp pilus assembly protein TadD